MSGTDPAARQTLTADLQRVAHGRIFFSHHSVGANVLGGMERLYTDAGAAVGPKTFKVIPLEKAAAEPGPAIVEAEGGENKFPDSKIDFFAAAIRNDRSLKPDLALMKFCYVDFNPRTDVDALFAHYESTLRALKTEHPEITFAHVTVPLVRRPLELKWRVLRVLRRPVWEDDANAKRGEFNQRLLNTFSGDPIFDLARAESTRPDGSRETFTHGAGVYFSLHPRYTTDGGHLNETGQRIVATEMVHFLAQTLQPAKVTAARAPLQ